MRPTRNINIQKPDIIKNHHLKKKNHPCNHTWTLQVWCQMNGKEGAIKQPLIFQVFFHHPLEGSGPQAPETSHPPWCRAEVVPSAHLHEGRGGWKVGGLTWGVGDLTWRWQGQVVEYQHLPTRGAFRKKKNYPDLKLTCSHPKMGRAPKGKFMLQKHQFSGSMLVFRGVKDGKNDTL